MKIWYQLNAFKHPGGLSCCPFLSSCSVVVDSLFTVAPIVCSGSVFSLCFVM